MASPYSPPVATLPDEDRATFIVNVYRHLLVAVGAFLAFEVLLFTTGLAETLWDLVSGSGAAWLLLLGAFMGVNWLTTMAASDLANPGKQYLGLFGTAAAEAVIFAPFLYYIFNRNDSGSVTVGTAAVITIAGFVLLTAVAMLTRKDLSFLRPLVMWGAIAALGLIVVALLFGLDLGTWFSVGMIALAGAAILYQTQTIMRRFPQTAYVAGAVMLFGSLMTMFWYVLRLVSDR